MRKIIIVIVALAGLFALRHSSTVPTVRQPEGAAAVHRENYTPMKAADGKAFLNHRGDW